ncbi:HNH endonuclease [Dictyobacter aurantiacus]|uniref:HNH nuclease domain-containing protein n=1 Tax=Dictyobacter aurantiacus TaxID=1936993 RepID=A0A401ZIG1_9CHLR|nr:HNH endonuclease [Dictyobacter aurantiacus]GCE06635.1 hypothetical protein KDAU_39640 [Dictyobacter aurantiacus]
MQFFFHHVGQAGSSDFDKTVFKDVDIAILNNKLTADIQDSAIKALSSLFPDGHFNCWGVPEGAKFVIRNLNAGDYVLLVESARIDGFIPALCHVKYYIQSLQPVLSEALWGNKKYPYIFFFQTEQLELPWIDFLEQVEYKPNFNPAGSFLSIRNERIAKFGEAEGYAKYLRTNYLKFMSTFNNISYEDLQKEKQSTIKEIREAPEYYDAYSKKEEINAELVEIHNLLIENGDDPLLTQDVKDSIRRYKYRDIAFSISVKQAYNFKCAICSLGVRGPKNETEVESAHFYPKGLNGSDDIRNGICLCRRHHWAFDVGWFAISDQYTVMINKNMPNDPDYDFIRDWEGKPINLPQAKACWPHLKFVREHRKVMNF